MKPKPPSSPDGSPLPPRHRPNKGNLAKDTTEMDLWAFDDTEAELETPPDPEEEAAGPAIPERDPEKAKAAKSGDEPAHIKVNVGKSRPLTSTIPGGQSRPETEFDDLDHWDDMASEMPDFDEAAEETPEAETPPAIAAPPAADPRDEFSPVVPENAVPMSLRPHLGLTKVERIGLASLLALLLIGGLLIFLNTINRLPTEAERVKDNDFPLQGKHLAIKSAESYWREPKATDTFRRGTQILPVLSLVAGSGSGAVRIFFRDSDGALVGDPVTRFVSSGSTIQIAATAGFDDVGMHAAYRTGQSKPWTIEVLEAPTENSPGTAFKKLFEMNISTVRR